MWPPKQAPEGALHQVTEPIFSGRPALVPTRPSSNDQPLACADPAGHFESVPVYGAPLTHSGVRGTSHASCGGHIRGSYNWRIEMTVSVRSGTGKEVASALVNVYDKD